MEKEENVKKNSSHVVLITIIIVSLFVVFFFLGYAIGGVKTSEKSLNSVINTSEDDQKEVKQEPTHEESYEKLSLDDAMVMEVNKLNPRALCGQSTLELEKRNRTVNEISSIEKMRMLASYLGVSTEESGILNEEKIKKFFLDTSFLEKYANGIPQGESLGYIYYDDVRFENNQLVFTNHGGVGCEGPSQGSFLELYSAKKNSKKLIVNYANYFREADREEHNDNQYYFIFKFYKDDTKASYLGEGKEYEDLDASLFSGYQFVYNIEDGNYLLEEINYLPLVTEG